MVDFTHHARFSARSARLPSWAPGLTLSLALGAAAGTMAGAALSLPVAVVAGALAAASAAVATPLVAGRYDGAAFGPGNAVTLVRGAAVVVILAAGLAATVTGTTTSGWAVLGLALAALALDGVDGWAARRFGPVTRFGARFDMEVDSLLAAGLALHAALAGVVPWAMPLLGGARYGFGLAGRIWPWLRAPLPPRFSRKAVCVAQIAGLIALQVPGLPAPIATTLALATAAALVWSFARDIRWLARQGR